MMDSRAVWVIAERRRIEGPWPVTRWTVAAVGTGTPATPRGTVVERGDGWERMFLGTTSIRLYRGETSNYLLNLRSERPTLYVFLRKAGGGTMRLLSATVDPGEVDVHADSGDDLIEAVPMPADLRDWMERFVAAHHEDRPVYRRARDRADPDALGTKPRSRHEQ